MPTRSSHIDPVYLSGDYFQASEGYRDAPYKIHEVMRLVDRYRDQIGPVRRVADVGCGAGVTTRLMHAALMEAGYDGVETVGFDVHPAVDGFEGADNLSFVRGDFCAVDEKETFDLILLLDVVEHVPDPVAFLKAVSARGRFVLIHLPLDDSLLSNVRNLARDKLRHPGHLIVLDVPQALNLIAFSGLRTLDYVLDPNFTYPSGRSTRAQRILAPLRRGLYTLSPYLAQRLLGGVSITIVARSPIDLDGE